MPTEIEILWSECDDSMTEEQIERAKEDQMLNDYIEEQEETEFEEECDFYQCCNEDYEKIEKFKKDISECAKGIESTVNKSLEAYHSTWVWPSRLSDPRLLPSIWASDNHCPNS